jgi:hypothetical protein
MQTNLRTTATLGGLEPGESTVCPTLKTRFHSFVPVVFALLIAFMLIGCGGGDGDDVFTLPGTENGGQPGNGDEPVAQVQSVGLLSSSPQLSSVGIPPATLTAFVRDANNALVPNTPVTFSADNDGTLKVIRSVTDESGTAQAELTTLGNKANRVITATATARGKSASVDVRVVGTSIAIGGSTSGLIGDEVVLTLTLRDSAGNPIAGEQLAVEFSGGNILTDANPITGANGQATVTLGLAAGGAHVVRVTGYGASATLTLTVSPDSLVFLVPEPPPAARTEIALNTTQPVTVQLDVAGTPVSGAELNFSATRGVLSSTSATTNAEGRATIDVSADSAGPSIISASVVTGAAAGTRAELEVLFVATIADSMSLQANPAVIGTNLAGETDQQSEIIAVVRDPNGNLVKNKTINFTLTDVTGGSLSPSSAVTDAQGRASTTYTAGPTSSAQNGVRIDAQVVGSPGVSNFVAITTARKALFITLGTGNIIEKPDAVRYVKPYGVLVTDASGNPVPNAQVTIEAWPTTYHKGFWVLTEIILPSGATVVRWERQATLTGIWEAGCPNEDLNRNGILDIPPDQDTNSNGVLDPGNVVTVTEANLTTDASGFADFGIVYFQQFATWIDLELTARAVVAGSEATEQVFFRLPILESDVTSRDVQPPGNPSPFGTSTTCADVN